MVSLSVCAGPMEDALLVSVSLSGVYRHTHTHTHTHTREHEHGKTLEWTLDKNGEEFTHNIHRRLHYLSFTETLCYSPMVDYITCLPLKHSQMVDYTTGLSLKHCVILRWLLWV